MLFKPCNLFFLVPSRIFPSRGDASGAVVSRQQVINESYDKLVKAAEVRLTFGFVLELQLSGN